MLKLYPIQRNVKKYPNVLFIEEKINNKIKTFGICYKPGGKATS